ncbi:MAG: AMP-binding protein [Pseudomonadota bacterium]
MADTDTAAAPPSCNTVQALLEWRASQHPHRPFLRFVGDDADASWTWAETRDAARHLAAALHAQGVGQGEHVAVMLPNGPAFVQSWLALGYLGAVMVAVNTEYIGSFLHRVLDHSETSTLIVDGTLVSAVAALDAPLDTLQRVLVFGEVDVASADALTAPVLAASACLAATDATDLQVARVGPADTACIMYTSGTTGAAKGVLMPEAHVLRFGQGAIDQLGVHGGDTYYICLPLFHINALGMQLCTALIAGARAVIRSRFSASAWLSDIRAHGCTVTNMLGALADFVLATPPSDLDRDAGLRLITMAPSVPAIVEGLRTRFAVPEVCALYGMTEVNIPLYSAPGTPLKPGSSGRVYSDAYDLAVVNPDTDVRCAAGEVGEIVVRPRQPFAFMQGYYRQAEQTVEAWRNLWFHTGDAAWMDADGDVFFVDRIKDCIRRRGENVSSAMVESEIIALPGVIECAAVAVPAGDGGGEDDILLVYVAEGSVTAEDLWCACAGRLPRFAVPRWWRRVDALPKTPTNKVRKQILRNAGTADGAWCAPGR